MRLALLALLALSCGGRGADEPAASSGPGDEEATPVPVGVLEPGDEPPPKARGDHLERAGCEQGRLEDCVGVAERSEEDRRAALVMACEISGRLCARAAGGSDPRLLERGCRAGSAPSCRAWATHGGASARALGCAAGWLEACETEVPGCGGTLAVCVRGAREALATGDAERARQLARIGCDGERTASCVVWSEVYAERDPDAARVALRRACLAEDPSACDALLARDDLSSPERSMIEALARGLAF